MFSKLKNKEENECISNTTLKNGKPSNGIKSPDYLPKFATMNFRNKKANDLKDLNSLPTKNVYSTTIPGMSNDESDEENDVEITAQSSYDNALHRSFTFGSKPLSKFISHSNLRSPETNPEKTTKSDLNEINESKLSQVDGISSNAKILEAKPTSTLEKFEHTITEKDSKKGAKAKFEFFRNSGNITSILPKMHPLGIFNKTASFRTKPKHTALANSETTATTEKVLEIAGLPTTSIDLMRQSEDTKEELVQADENYIDQDLSLNWINEALRDEGSSYYESPIYTAFFSELATSFYNHLVRQGQSSWPKKFTGREAVDIICTILDTNDRKLALLLGRALDLQNFICHVSQEMRLRDSLYETYQLDSHLKCLDEPNGESAAEILPNGVFTLLTDCYSPTCAPGSHCYSITCPNRPNEVDELEKPSNEIARNVPETTKEELWEKFASPEIVKSVTDRERKRQEIIFELIYTERDFVSDLKVIQELYLIPLMVSDILPDDSRDSFVEEVFINILELQKGSFELSAGLSELQAKSPLINSIGKVFLDHLKAFEPFKEYGAKQVYSKRRLAAEQKSNVELDSFLKEQATHPDCRKLPIQSFLSRPTTRLGRYPLLLEAVLKYTAEDNPDINEIPIVITSIKEVLSDINVKAGKADNKVRLADLRSQLIGADALINELDLTNESRLMVREGSLKKKSGVDMVDIFIYLFDNYLLMTKRHKNAKDPDTYDYKISKKPIKLDMLVLSEKEVQTNFKSPGTGPIPLVNTETAKATQFPLTLTHLGRNGGSYTMYCSTHTDRSRWKAVIEETREKITLRNKIFATNSIADYSTCPSSIIHCSAFYERIIFLGTEDGLYARFPKSEQFVKALALDKILQIEVIEECNLLVLQSDKTLYTLPLNSINPTMEKITPDRLKNHTNFFAVGVCLGHTLICAVKSTNLKSTIKVYRPALADPKSTTSTPKSSLFGIGLKDSIEVFKEFYIPSEASNIFFLKSKLCVACSMGFEIVDLTTLKVQSLLHTADPSLDFVFSRKETVKPISFFRIREGTFFICYDEFGFFVDRIGKLLADTTVLHWKGVPKAFALHYPYVLAIEPTLIEVWSLETGHSIQVISGNHLQVLRCDSEHIHYLDNSTTPDLWVLYELTVNSAHPRNVSFRRNLRDARVSKRRGIIDHYNTLLTSP